MKEVGAENVAAIAAARQEYVGREYYRLRVPEAEHYPYSSASNYATETDLLDMAVVDLPMF